MVEFMPEPELSQGPKPKVKHQMQDIEEEGRLAKREQGRDASGDLLGERAEKGQEQEVEGHGEGQVGEAGRVFNDVEERAEGGEILVPLRRGQLLGHAEAVFGEVADVQEAS